MAKKAKKAEATNADIPSELVEVEVAMRSGCGMVYLRTHEERRACAALNALADRWRKSFETWSVTNGWSFKSSGGKSASSPNRDTKHPVRAISAFVEHKPSSPFRGTIGVLLDYHFFLDDGQPDPEIIRAIKDGLCSMRQHSMFLVVVSCRTPMPDELSKEIPVLEFTLPGRDCVRGIVEEVLGRVNDTTVRVPVGDGMVDLIVEECLGLTSQEVNAAISMAIIRYMRIDRDALECVQEMKVHALRQGGLLEYYPSERQESIQHVGGLDNLKEWLKLRTRAFTDPVEAAGFGLPCPKGILLIGVPGCGKSLMAKAVANQWHLPLIRFDPGKAFASLVGQSEERIRSVCSQASAMAPCVSGDTEIQLSDGMVRTAEDLFLSGPETGASPSETGASPLEVASVSASKGLLGEDSMVFRTPRAVLQKPLGDRKMLLVETFGSRVSVTEDHRLLTLAGYVPAGKLKKGDWVVGYLGPAYKDVEVPIWGFIPEGTRAYWRISGASGGRLRKGKDYVYIEDGIRPKGSQVPVFLSKGRGGWTDSKLDVWPDAVSEDLGEFIGLIESDGSYLYGRTMTFINSDEALLSRFSELSQRLFGVTPRRYLNQPSGYRSQKADGEAIVATKDSFRLVVNSLLAYEMVRRVSDSVLHQNMGLVARGYLRGFFLGDGVAEPHRNRLTFVQAKPENRRKIQNILRRIGIVRRWNGKHFYITGIEDIIRLVRWARLPVEESDFHGVKYSAPRGVRVSGDRTFATRVVSVHLIDEDRVDGMVYDVSMASAPHNYVSGGLVSHNCVLWVDEVEKGMAGMGSSGALDSGVTARVFGTFLTWMQENTSPVFVVATANSVASLAPELVRRFDEVWGVDLPTPAERREIWRIQISKARRDHEGRDPGGFDLKELVEASKLLSGHEIEKCYLAALLLAFHERREVTTEDIKLECQRITPVASSMAESIEAIRQWSKTHARPASKPSDEAEEERAAGVGFLPLRGKPERNLDLDDPQPEKEAQA